MLNEDLCADAHQNDAAEYLGLTAQPAAEDVYKRQGYKFEVKE